jgi:hypothetical protein
MSYVVFDLDLTLADITSFYYFLISFHIKEFVLETSPTLFSFFPEELHKRLQKAYHLFVERVAVQEASANPMGLLRPGILDIMRDLAALYHKRKVKKVMIYSNNRYLPSLQFVRDVIHHIIKTNLITDCIHWHHPSRDNDKMDVQYSKTWDTMHSLCFRGVPIEPKQVYFFDDQAHVQLQQRLQENYYQVPAYHYTVQFDRIKEIYRSVMHDAEVNVSSLIVYMMDVMEAENQTFPFYPNGNSIRDLLHILENLSRGAPWPNSSSERDEGYHMMKDVVKEIQKQLAPKRPKRHTIRQRRYTIKR